MAAITLGRPINARVTGPRGFSRTTAGRLARVSVKVEGHQRIVGKLQGQKFWIQPTNDLMLDLQRRAYVLAKKRAPKLTGDAQSKIKKRTHKAIFLKFADVVLEPSIAKSDKAFRYSFALDAARKRAPKGMAGTGLYKRVRRSKAPRLRVNRKNAPYKYQSGSFARRPTFNWFHGTSKLMARELRSGAMAAAHVMQRRWSA